MEKNTTKIESNSEWSSEDKKPASWQYSLCYLFMPISLLLTFVGSFLMKLGNYLMFDTHHLEIKLTPKD